ncbi:MAG: sugar phosphate isomerase/epimerase [Desulforhabdus sp.]|jgi:sugar phosphate isomerase/epimerase|nr:sugar phosphate isomerase/epimerase [Desulforhabdus sp.]
MPELIENMLEAIKQVHVNVPWKFLPDYMNIVLQHQMNVEIGFSAEELDRSSRSEFKAAAARLSQRGCAISLHAPFWDLCPGSLDPMLRHVTCYRLQQFFDLVSVFEPVHAVCHTGYDPSHHSGQRESWVEKSIAIWEPLVERAERSKVPLLLENVWERDPTFHLELLQAIPSRWFGFCLDVGHQNSFSRTELVDWVESLADFLMEIHLHDNDGTADSHLPVGQGNIDFLYLFDLLRSRNLKPTLTLEPHKEEHLYQSLAALNAIFLKMSVQPKTGSRAATERTAQWP